jgi:hypothetical protein
MDLTGRVELQFGLVKQAVPSFRDLSDYDRDHIRGFRQSAAEVMLSLEILVSSSVTEHGDALYVVRRRV